MPFPTGWPPRPASSLRSIRVYLTGNSTANFPDNAFLFSDVTGADTFTKMPKVGWGDEGVQVKIGDLTKGGSPYGGGTGPDPNYTAPPSEQAVPKNMIWSQTIRVVNSGGNDIEISFDGTNVQGKIKAGTEYTYRVRYEAGIALRSPGGASSFWVEAW